MCEHEAEIPIEVSNPAVTIENGEIHFNTYAMQMEVFWGIVKELQDAGIELKREDLLCG